MATYSEDPTLYLYTSLTAGSSHIVTATSRLETILRANRIPFKGLDVATDEKARMLWGRRAGKDESGRQRKLPGLVQMGTVIGDLVEVEDWNEYGELKGHVKIVAIDGFKTAPPSPPVKPPTSASQPTSSGLSSSLSAAERPREAGKKTEILGATPTAFTMAMMSVGAEAAAKAKAAQKVMVGTAQGVSKKVEEVVLAVKGSDAPSDAKSADSSVSSPWAMYTDSILQAEDDGTWSRSSNAQSQDGPISSVIESKESLQSPTSGTWKNNPQGSLTSAVGS